MINKQLTGPSASSTCNIYVYSVFYVILYSLKPEEMVFQNIGYLHHRMPVLIVNKHVRFLKLEKYTFCETLVFKRM